MKKIILSILAAASVGLSSCAAFNSSSGQALVNAAVLVAVDHYVEAHPTSKAQVLAVADVLDTAANVSTNQLTKDEFLALVKKASTHADVVILGSALFDVYAQNLKLPANAGKYAATLHSVAKSLRDAVNLVPTPVATVK